MAKNKISEFSSTAANNTDISNINIAEGCSPANVNNAIRSLMAQLKDQQDGTSGDPFTCAGTLTSSGTIDITGGFKLDGSTGTSGQVLLSAGSSTPTWGSAIPSGGIIIWSGSSASIPTGWLLCNGSSGTPDLRNRFVVGAGSTYAVGATGGSADAIVVSHTHTVTDPGHTHTATVNAQTNVQDSTSGGDTRPASGTSTLTTNSNTTGISINTTGSSGTNANLPPYYALCYIMKS